MATLNAFDIKFYKSVFTTGGITSLGGAIDTGTEINSFTLHNLLDKTTKDQAKTGITKFRCIHIKNMNTQEPIRNPILTIPQNTISSNDEVTIGWDPSGINSPAQTITDQHDPPDNVTFTTAPDRINGAVLGQNIPPQSTKPFWIRMVSTFNTQEMLTNGLVIRLLCDNLVTAVIDEAPKPSPQTSFTIMAETDLNETLDNIVGDIQHRNANFNISCGNNSDESTTTNAEDWFNVLGPSLSRVTRLALGGHDMLSQSQINQYLNKYGIANKFHAFTFQNCHFLFMDTASGPDAYSQASEQYEFVINDLKNASSDSAIDWIFVVMNRAMYASQTTTETKYVLKSLRDLYHPLFEKYGVHIVLNGDFKNYQRSHILHFNEANSDNPTSILTSMLDVDGSQLTPYVIQRGHDRLLDGSGNTGCLFLTCGVGGSGHHNIPTPNTYTAFHNTADFGYLFTKLRNNVKKLFDENDINSEIIEEYHELIIAFHDELQDLILDQCIIRKYLRRNAVMKSKHVYNINWKYVTRDWIMKYNIG